MVFQRRKLLSSGFFMGLGDIFAVLVQLLLFPCYTRTVGSAGKLLKKLSEFLIDAMLP